MINYAIGSSTKSPAGLANALKVGREYANNLTNSIQCNRTTQTGERHFLLPKDWFYKTLRPTSQAAAPARCSNSYPAMAAKSCLPSTLA